MHGGTNHTYRALQAAIVYQPLCSNPTTSNTNLLSLQFCTCPYKYTTCPCSPTRVCFLRVSPGSSATGGPGSGMPAALRTARCHQPPTALPAQAFRHQGPGLTPATDSCLMGNMAQWQSYPAHLQRALAFLRQHSLHLQSPLIPQLLLLILSALRIWETADNVQCK